MSQRSKNEQHLNKEPVKPSVNVGERDDSNYPQDRSEGEMGTHEGGKNRPPHSADQLHGDTPRDLPPNYRGR